MSILCNSNSQKILFNNCQILFLMNFSSLLGTTKPIPIRHQWRIADPVKHWKSRISCFVQNEQRHNNRHNSFICCWMDGLSNTRRRNQWKIVSMLLLNDTNNRTAWDSSAWGRQQKKEHGKWFFKQACFKDISKYFLFWINCTIQWLRPVAPFE